MRVRISIAVDVDIDAWNYNFGSQDKAADVRRNLPSFAQSLVQTALEDIQEDWIGEHTRAEERMAS